MGNYRLIALDMDGTLLNSELKLPEENRAAIELAQSMGKEVVLSTGRCLAEIRETLSQLPKIRYLVCENGSCVYDVKYDRTMHVDPIPTQEVLYILEQMRGERVVIQVFHENLSYVNQANDEWMQAFRMSTYREVFKKCSMLDVRLFDGYAERPFRIEKINLYFDNAQTENYWAEALAARPLIVSKSIAYMIELVSDKADKSRGLAALCAHLNIPMSEIITVGDSPNDLGMLKAAGLGVAMGNARAEVQAVADAITDDCDHSGVAKVIHEYLLK